ncbi:hypothetical protein KDD17_16320 [Sulfitobacter albidus]|uniref:Lipoprotein n=1 Tax=Sulfitobacter albidus TaxID=2829501 RepID=A0A975JE80_9RHOB|nr:hypothetical protein [Sulfitobacter albidus]QUJ76425.1 hypothetical protein KDD17_16320 [Sulfitobacter albidus]
MRIFFAILMVLGLAACDETPGSSGGDNARDSKARAMIGFVAADPVLRAFPQACQTAVYKTGANRPGPVADCTTNPRQCLSQCKAGNRKACFDAAQIVEVSQNPDDNLATYPLYMRGCALGDGNACVNAGATIKNTSWSGGKPAAAATPACQFRTFSRMCDEGHPWGCYMTAQEYRRGGFRGKSEARYETYMRRACKISTTSGACLGRFR